MQMTKTRPANRRASTFDDTASAVSSLASTMVSAVEDFVEEMTTNARGDRGRAPLSRGRGRTRGCERCGHERCRCQSEPCGCGRSDCDGCDCEDCAPSSCDCLCCIGDVDLVVYTRVGERRVVPIEIHNPRRREREIEIELSSFTTRSGKPAGVVATLIGDGKVTLAPCATHELILVVNVATTDVKDGDDVMRRATGERVIDVDDCLVAVADLRVVGCDMRAQRIALAILPRRCAAHEVECRSGCC